MYNYKNNLKKNDLILWKLIKKEKNRQEKNINLIASESYTSISIMEALGNCLTNKYAEGYPNNRYYEGCKYIDYIENLAIKRAKLLFKVDYVNVQPHSGSQANFAVYNALLNSGDIILSMKLSHGGHLTHGSFSNFSGKFYKIITYGINNYGDIDYINLIKLAQKYRPKMIISGFSSYSGLINWKKIRKIADSISAIFFVDMSHIAGLVVTGLYPNPIKYAHVLTTTTHKTLSGPRGGLILVKNGNKKLYKKLDSSVFPFTQGGPFMNVIAAKAASFKEAMHPSFKKYQKKIIKNSKIMLKIFLNRKFNIISNNTYNHMFLVNLKNKNINGKEASFILSKANIIVNKNCIPNDKKKHSITSGIRIGTSSISRRNINKKYVKKISNYICDIINNKYNLKNIKLIKKKILKICLKYPIYN